MGRDPLSRQSETPPRKPAYLVVALITLWLVGLNTIVEGYLAVQIVTDPFASVLRRSDGAGERPREIARREVLKDALVQAVGQHRSVTLPLGIGQVMLGGLLLIVAMHALFGRRASPAFVLQVVAANVLLLGIGYVLREPVRAAIVDAVAEGAALGPPESIEALKANWRWSFRIELLLHALALGFGGVSLTRKTARAVLAPAEPHPGGEP